MKKMKDHQLRNGLILITFGVCLYTILQHLGDFSGAVGFVLSILRPIVLGFTMAFVLNVLMSAIERILGLLPPLKKKRRILRGVVYAGQTDGRQPGLEPVARAVVIQLRHAGIPGVQIAPLRLRACRHGKHQRKQNGQDDAH